MHHVRSKRQICHAVFSVSVVPTHANQVQHVQLYLSQNGLVPQGKFRSFSTESSIRYEPFCDDFGPMNMASVFTFVNELDTQIMMNVHAGSGKLVYHSESGQRSLTNACFLLGAYMILKLDLPPQDVHSYFDGISGAIEEYRDATYSKTDFKLALMDCWRGLHRGRELGWVTLPSSASSSIWGQIDENEYSHYNDPLNGDLHEVVPHKFIAFRGPADLDASLPYVDNLNPALQYREFGPRYYAELFKLMGVTTVVRLNEASSYDKRIFAEHGINHFDLYFDDCTSPPPAVVARFCRIADDAPGRVAVHCRAGLGRTGTLIALYLMRTHGFSARGAIGWLRIMRPGSVIGEQQHYLCDVEYEVSRRAAAAARPPAEDSHADSDSDPPPPTHGPRPMHPLAAPAELSKRLGQPPAAAAAPPPVVAAAATRPPPISARGTSESSARALAEQVSEAVGRRAAAMTRIPSRGRLGSNRSEWGLPVAYQ